MTSRNRRSGVEDRWHKTIRDDNGTEKRVPSSKYGRGLRWQARWVADDGCEQSKSFDTKGAAKQWLDPEITAKVATGTYVPPRAGALTVTEVYTSWSASQGHIAAKTAATRKSLWHSHVEPQWGMITVADVKTAAVRGWVAKLKAEGVGVTTIENAFGLLRQVLGSAVEDTRIPRNPCDGVKLPKREHSDRGYLVTRSGGRACRSGGA